jgi:hypothetical protein
MNQFLRRETHECSKKGHSGANRCYLISAFILYLIFPAKQYVYVYMEKAKFSCTSVTLYIYIVSTEFATEKVTTALAGMCNLLRDKPNKL